ncbi:MAG: recombinase family protein, partial [Chloroflexi bacterium]|nr:recombinase family protein [Chloroflexota bacterium]
VIVAYCLDRLSRDPVHFILLQEEMEKAGVEIILATETVDSTDMGKLITHVKGYAAKLEVERIKERTGRGMRTRALSGKLPNGRGGRLYGYIYMRGKGEGRGIRVPDEEEAAVVRQMYAWLAEDGLSTYAITKKLRSSSYPPPDTASTWNKSTVHGILTNPSYSGRTFVFQRTRVKSAAGIRNGRPKVRDQWRPREDWIEIPDATPAIITEELFNAAQERLQRNRELAIRNTKREYLLRGHIKCRWCGRSYTGHTQSGVIQRSYYRCGGRHPLDGVKCRNRNFRVDYLDGVVWEKVEGLLANPELVLIELMRTQDHSEDGGALQIKLDRVKVQLANREKQRTRVWKAYQITGDEETFRRSIAQLEKEIDGLKREQLQLQSAVEASRQSKPDILDVKKACDLVRQNVKSLSFNDKRLALEALQVRVWTDGDKVEIEGAIPITDLSIASMSPT